MDRKVSRAHEVIRFVLFAVLGLSPMGKALAADNYLQVESPQTFVYEEPRKESGILRRLFQGEVVRPVENIKGESGSSWVKIKIADAQMGYIPLEKFTRTLPLPEQRWSPDRVSRHETPISFALRSGGELFGPGLNLRFMGLTRLGVMLDVGSILDHGDMRGTSLAAGIVVAPALGQFSPIIETGLTRLSYHDNHSILRISCFFLTAGIEWMFDSGFFLNAGVTYNRSTDVEIAYEAESAINGPREIGDYGRFNVVKKDPSYQAVNPVYTMGYAF